MQISSFSILVWHKWWSLMLIPSIRLAVQQQAAVLQHGL
jgi:hypothetical protein